MMSDPAPAVLDHAREFLAGKLPKRAPEQLQVVAAFDERPLEGEAAVTVLAFELPPANPDLCAADYDPRHYVVVGGTEPDFFPAYGFDGDDAYSFHVGTRFLLTVGARGIDVREEPERFRPLMRRFINDAVQGRTVAAEELVVLFAVDEHYFGVYRVEIAGESVYFMGCDLPPGFYRATHLPAPVVLRLHLGKVIRAEAREEAAAAEKSRD